MDVQGIYKYQRAAFAKTGMAVHFGGYRLIGNNQAEVFWPGNAPEKNGDSFQKTTLRTQNQTGTDTEPMRWDEARQVWVSNPVPLGSEYQIQVNGKPVIDAVEVDPVSGLNRIAEPRLHQNQARKLGPIAHIYRDAVLPPEKRDELLRLYQEGMGESVGMPYVHRLSYGGTGKDMLQLVPMLKKAGFQSILTTPLSGADTTSPHAYFTIDPWTLNESFPHKDAFRDFITALMRHDLKLFFDVAFVNQGLNGIQYLSNLYHGAMSPYWDWLIFDNPLDQPPLHAPGATVHYPRHAVDKLKIGVLPTVENARAETIETNWDAIGLRILNDPQEANYNPGAPTWLQLYDTRIQLPDGHPRKTDHVFSLLSSDQLIQYKFPVRVEELAEKRRILRKNGWSLDETSGKRLFTDWKTWQLVPPKLDDAAYKWDGQLDVRKMNMHNPEVVQEMASSLGYWARLVRNAEVRELAPQLAQQLRMAGGDTTPEAMQAAVSNLTRNAQHPNRPLPPVKHSFETATLGELSALQQTVQAERDASAHDISHIAARLSSRMLDENPLSTQPLPTLFKAITNQPEFRNEMRQASLYWPAQVASWALYPFTFPLKLSQGLNTWVDTHTQRLQAALRPDAFQDKLSETLGSAMEMLDESEREKLRYPLIQSVVGERLMDALYQHLLAGRSLAPGTPAWTREQLETGFYATVPPAISMADPITGVGLLTGFLKQRLESLTSEDRAAIAHFISHELAELTPESTYLAQDLVINREWGLNVRADALKDVGDIDRIKSLEGRERREAFLKETDRIEAVWNTVSNAVKQVNPRAIMLGELTHYPGNLPGPALTDKDDVQQVARANERRIFGPFDTIVNFFTATMLGRVVHDNPLVWEIDPQVDPATFMNQVLVTMRQFPWPAAQRLQTIVDTQDWPAISHALATNPSIGHMDANIHWGLTDDLRVVSRELRDKAPYQSWRNGFANRKAAIQALTALENWAGQSDNVPFMERLPADLKTFITSDEKERLQKEGVRIKVTTPRDVKQAYIDWLFEQPDNPVNDILPEPRDRTALKDALKNRLAEPSENRATKAAITNALEAQANLSAALKDAFYYTMNRVAEQWNIRYGYIPLDFAINAVVRELLSHGQISAKQAESLRLDLYKTIMAPAIEKMPAIAAMMVGMPGQPSIYFHSFTAQTGNENQKNRAEQQRNVLRLDWLDPNHPSYKPWVAEHAERLSTVVSLRERYPVLNDGALVPIPNPERFNQAGIVPFVRDDGEGNQAILLVNTGKPRQLDWNHPLGEADTATYASPDSTQPKVNNFVFDAGGLGLPTGARYRLVDETTGELSDAVFEIKTSRDMFGSTSCTLVNAKTGKGVDFTSYALLIREPSASHQV